MDGDRTEEIAVAGVRVTENDFEKGLLMFIGNAMSGCHHMSGIYKDGNALQAVLSIAILLFDSANPRMLVGLRNNIGTLKLLLVEFSTFLVN